MRLPDGISAWCERDGRGGVVAVEPLGGGCINDVARLRCVRGSSLVAKANAAAPAGMFAREAEGLAELAAGDGPRVPRALAVDECWLLLEDLGHGARDGAFWATLGERLAALHGRTSPRFGFARDNWLGTTPQANAWCDDGWSFFAQRRLGDLALRCRDAGALDTGEAARVDRLGARLRELVPEQPASLLHGDLWSGNVVCCSDGAPAILDPATHYGWAEAELGMCDLFGGFPRAFWDAYVAVRPLASGWRERLPLYQLHHLLNHLLLFGVSYRVRVLAILARFA